MHLSCRMTAATAAHRRRKNRRNSYTSAAIAVRSTATAAVRTKVARTAELRSAIRFRLSHWALAAGTRIRADKTRCWTCEILLGQPHLSVTPSTTVATLTLPMPEGRGFLVRQPLRRLRRIGVLHDFPKREFPCAPRYTLFQFMPLWIYLPKPCTGCSLQHSHLCRDAFHTSGNPIREHSNPLSVGSDSHKQSMSDSTGRTYRP